MIRRCLAGLLVALLFAPPAVSAQTGKAGIVTTLEGNVSARRVAIATPVALRFKDDVYQQDVITTGDRSLARMLLGGKAVVTVRERSVLTITEVPGRSTIALESGKFALAVAREKMGPNEEIQIRTPNAVAGVRGTVVVTEIVQQGAQTGVALPAVQTNFFVLRGTIVAQPFDAGAGRPLGTPLQVGTLQSYSGAGLAPPRLQPIRPEQVGQINAGLQPTALKSTGGATTETLKTQAVQTAVTLLGALSGDQAILTALTPAAPTSIADLSSSGSFVQAPITPLEQVSSTELTELTSSVAPSPASSFTGSFTSTSPNPLFSFAGNSGLSSPGSFLAVGAGGSVALSGSLAQFIDSSVSAGGSLFEIVGGSVSTTGTSAALITLDPTAITAQQNVFFMDGGTLTLSGPLLTDVNGTIFTGGEFVKLTNGALVVGTSPAAFVQLDGTTVEGTGALSMSSSTMQLAGPLVVAHNLGSTEGGFDPGPDVPMFLIDNGSVLTSTTTSPLIQLSLLAMDPDQPLIRVATGSTVSLQGGLLSATDTLIAPLGDLLEVVGATVQSTGSAPLLDVSSSSVVIGPDGVFADGQPSLLNLVSSASTGAPGLPALVSLAGPLARFTDAHVEMVGNVVNVRNGATLTGAAAADLLQLSDGDLTANGLLTIAGFGGSSGTTPATVTWPGSILSATNASISLAGAAINVGPGGVLHTTTGSLIRLQEVSFSAQGGLQIAGVACCVGTATIGGPVLSALDSLVTFGGHAVSVSNGASLTGTSTNPLVTLDGTALSFAAPFTALLTVGGPGTTATLNGPILAAINFSEVSNEASGLGGPLVAAGGGGVLSIANQSGPIVSFTGNSSLSVSRGLLTVGPNDGAFDTNGSTGALFSFVSGSHTLSTSANPVILATGTNTVNEDVFVDDLDGGLTLASIPLASDRSLRHGGSFVELDGAASASAGSGVQLDRALLEASAPLLNLKNGASLSIVNGNGVDLNNQAKLSSLVGPLIKLDASSLAIAGHAFNVAGGSFVKVTTGDLISLTNGSLLSVGGSLLNISGNSVVQINNGTVLTINNSSASITGAFVNFGVGPGALNVANGLTPFASCGAPCGGLPIAFSGGAGPGNVSVTGAIQGSGTAQFNGGAAIHVIGGGSSLSILGN